MSLGYTSCVINYTILYSTHYDSLPHALHEKKTDTSHLNGESPADLVKE